MRLGSGAPIPSVVYVPSPTLHVPPHCPLRCQAWGSRGQDWGGRKKARSPIWTALSSRGQIQGAAKKTDLTDLGSGMPREKNLWQMCYSSCLVLLILIRMKGCRKRSDWRKQEQWNRKQHVVQRYVYNYKPTFIHGYCRLCLQSSMISYPNLNLCVPACKRPGASMHV